MLARGVLLIALLAAAATAAQGAQSSFYSNVASCVAQELKKQAIDSMANAVGIAQTDASTQDSAVGAAQGAVRFSSVDYYIVGFAPGIGCALISVITTPPPTDQPAEPGSPALLPHYQMAALIAVSPNASRVSTNGFTCKFTAANAAYTPAMVKNLIKYIPWSTTRGAAPLNDSAAVYKLPANLSSLSGKVRCSYVLYAKTGFNFTGGSTCVPNPGGNPDFPFDCTQAPPFDLPSMAWHFDKDNKPAASSFNSSSMSVTCQVNRALVNRTDTQLLFEPNDGCFPAAARVVTPSGPKPIAQLAVGDKVLAVDAATGKAVFNDVYLTPHRDADAAATYLNIHATPVGGKGSSKVLTLTPSHYMPTACGAEQQQQKQKQCLKHAREVAAGDLVWLLQGQQAELARVDEVTASTEQGMYSPWTLSGSIVVEGFAASTHTAWPYEAQLLQLLPRKHAVAAQHALAQVHQAVQAPLRAVYRTLGKGPLAMLDSVIFSVMQAAKAPYNGLPAAVHAAARATTAA